MADFPFSSRIAVVTGGTRGIGAAVTRMLLENGATVVATHGGNVNAAEEFLKSLPEEQAARCETRSFDVADAKQVEGFFADFDEGHDRLDFLVNCAGIRQDGVAAMLPEESWRRVLAVNLDGAFLMAKQAILRMLPRRQGRLVFITSPMGRLGWSGQSNYSASRGGRRRSILSAGSPGGVCDGDRPRNIRRTVIGRRPPPNGEDQLPGQGVHAG